MGSANATIRVERKVRYAANELFDELGVNMFLYFLDRNGALFAGGRKAIADSTLVAVTVMIAESKPEEKDAMVALVMNFLTMGAGE